MLPYVCMLRIAGIVLFVGVLLAQTPVPDQQKNPFAGDSAAIAAGQRFYAQTCQVCHGGNAGGGDRAPALSNGVFPHGSSDNDLFQSIRFGIPGTQMSAFPALTSDQVWQLVSYLRSLGAGPAATNPNITGDAAAGENLFFGKAGCAACHAVNSRGANVGPDLSNAGRTAAETLRRKIVEPNANPNPGGRGGPSTLIVRTKDGQELRGIRRGEDSFSVLMTDASGKLVRLDKRNLSDQRTDSTSLMPADYAQRFSAVEIQNLVAYLRVQNGRDLTKTILADISGGLSYERLRNAQAEPQNWLTYWGDYRGRHYSALKEIGVANVRGLQVRWAAQMPGDSILEAMPLVVDGVMYTSGMPGQVFALDAKTGLQLWRYQRQQKVVPQGEINRFNRGVAMLGNRVFVGTLDAALVALDARSGLPLWEIQVADARRGYSLTSAPLALKDKIVVGVSGGEFGAPGFIDAYDPATGKRLWRFNTIPGPGEFGHDTWKGDSWQLGGSPTWLTGSYDPDLDVLYWTVGNPGPDIDADVRSGDNLFSCSVLALDPATGQRKWHYQFTPGDSHDWDSTEDVILVDRVYRGQPRKLLLQADRNGMFYVLDRTNGKLLSGTPFVRQTWNTGFDANGRPKFVPGWDSSPAGSIPIYPSLGGGTNWQAPSYSPETGWMYVETQESGQVFVRSPQQFESGRQYQGGRGQGLGEPTLASIKAIDPETGGTKWAYRISRGSLAAGVLATAGGVVFAATAEGSLIALDARTGALLWHVRTGGTMASSPISYAVDGKEFVAIAAGGVLYSFGLPDLD
jgi:PQQ-dependent dehydrogenase (methanol/ethanol family)